MLNRTIMFVGEAPSRTSDPRDPLSGKAMRDKLVYYFGFNTYSFAIRRNLLTEWPGKSAKGDAFPIEAARRGAARIAREIAGSDDFVRVILLGRRVARAFDLSSAVPLKWWYETADGSDLAVFPHPSGVNRWFNDPLNRRAARRFGKETMRWSRQ